MQPLPCMQSPDALTHADPPNLAATVLLVGWGLPGRAPEDGVGLLTILGDLLFGMGLIRGTSSKQRFDEVWNNDFGWAYEPLIEGALHLQSRALCVCQIGGDSVSELRRLSVGLHLLRRGRAAVRSGDVLTWVR